MLLALDERDACQKNRATLRDHGDHMLVDKIAGLTSDANSNLRLTANMTAKLMDGDALRRTFRERLWGYFELRRMSVDGPHARPAVCKTVCGALLRRPGWVRFPFIPANFPWSGRSRRTGH